MTSNRYYYHSPNIGDKKKHENDQDEENFWKNVIEEKKHFLFSLYERELGEKLC